MTTEGGCAECWFAELCMSPSLPIFPAELHSFPPSFAATNCSGDTKCNFCKSWKLLRNTLISIILFSQSNLDTRRLPCFLPPQQHCFPSRVLTPWGNGVHSHGECIGNAYNNPSALMKGAAGPPLPCLDCSPVSTCTA